MPSSYRFTLCATSNPGRELLQCVMVILLIVEVSFAFRNTSILFRYFVVLWGAIFYCGLTSLSKAVHAVCFGVWGAAVSPLNQNNCVVTLLPSNHCEMLPRTPQR